MELPRPPPHPSWSRWGGTANGAEKYRFSRSRCCILPPLFVLFVLVFFLKNKTKQETRIIPVIVLKVKIL